MDNRVTVRFFRIDKAHDTAPKFEDALANALAVGSEPIQRERDLGDGVIVRLEGLANDTSFIDGEVVRRQMAAFPPEVTDKGLNPLPLSDGAGLGHSIAFRFAPALRVLAIQFDNRKVSVRRLLHYLNEIDNSAGYIALPLVRRDAWERYGDGLPRKLILKIARPDLLSVEGAVDTVKDASKRLAEQFNGPMINIEIGMGHRRGNLAKAAVDKTIRYFTSGKGRSEDVRELKVVIGEADDKQMIDFIDELLNKSETLDLPENDPIKNYTTRKLFVRSCFSDNLSYIKDTYG